MVNLEDKESIVDFKNTLSTIESKINGVLDELEKKGSKRPKTLIKKCAEQFKYHPDKSFINPIVLPVTIICTNFNSFKQMDSLTRRTGTNLLRLLALKKFASIFFVDFKADAGSLKVLKNHLNFTIFKQSKNVNAQMDFAKGFAILAGMDNSKSIMDTQGDPSVSLEALQEEFNNIPSYANKTEVKVNQKANEERIDAILKQRQEKLYLSNFTK
ncbi:hypothetical protein O9G_003965 [Rozella allomycis CSF55]|uniref:Uncharacterized protein n=1 Tax=Rozella allomycis (strain CSF55) TaxID=988480 RepID=A0A075AZ45_ROZAC|nr:hypothetical protein O9G_003965 [Rozella allomycis CSF55]|eukprot:EPZ35532.1 hypothetical protein O9G_003965 [Rozella allomycis CSF55]